MIIKAFKAHTFIILFFAVMACESKKYEIQYYENGNVKIKAELKNDLRDGILEVYYPNGKLKSNQYWKNGEANGNSHHYYENGQLESEVIWEDNKPNGPFKSYYESGELFKEGFFSDSVLVDTLNFYYKGGQIMERHYYNTYGSLRWAKKFRENGDLKEEYTIPLFLSLKDSIRISERYKLEIVFESQYDDIKLVMDKNEKDTINTLESNPNSFYYECSPPGLGDNYLKGKILGYKDQKLKAEVSFSHHYYVKN